MVDLCLVFLGGVSLRNFRTPGAYHMARWMAKGIYSLKISLFRDQLPMTPRDGAGIRRVASLVAMINGRYWNEATISAYAPKNVVDFIQAVQKYDDQELAGAAARAMRRHLWYVAEELVGLALFDDRVTDDQKTAMVQTMKICPPSKNSSKRLDGKKIDSTPPLSAWSTNRSLVLFTVLLLGKKPAFLDTSLNLVHGLDLPAG